MKPLLDWLAGKKTYICLILYMALSKTGALTWLGVPYDTAKSLLDALLVSAGLFIKAGQGRIERKVR